MYSWLSPFRISGSDSVSECPSSSSCESCVAGPLGASSSSESLYLAAVFFSMIRILMMKSRARMAKPSPKTPARKGSQACCSTCTKLGFGYLFDQRNMRARYKFLSCSYVTCTLGSDGEKTVKKANPYLRSLQTCK